MLSGCSSPGAIFFSVTADKVNQRERRREPAVQLAAFYYETRLGILGPSTSILFLSPRYMKLFKPFMAISIVNFTLLKEPVAPQCNARTCGKSREVVRESKTSVSALTQVTFDDFHCQENSTMTMSRAQFCMNLKIFDWKIPFRGK